MITQCGYMKKNGLQFSCPVSDCPCAFTVPKPGCPPLRAAPAVMRMKYWKVIKFRGSEWGNYTILWLLKRNGTKIISKIA